MRAFLYIAWIGLVLSVAVHIMTLTGHNEFLDDWEAFIFFLHGGVILLGLPVVLTSQKLMKGKDRKDFGKVVLENRPGWMKNLISLCVMYGFLSFIIGWFFTKSGPVAGAPFKQFSSMWIVGYSLEMGVIYSYLHRPLEKSETNSLINQGFK